MSFSILKQKIDRSAQFNFGLGASSNEIDNAQELLNIPLQGSYRLFLQEFGWLDTGVIEIYGLGSDVPKHLNLVDITRSERTEMHPPLLHHLIPVMNDGSGNLYCIDSRPKGIGAIVFWDHDLNADQEPEFVALSFEKWLYEKLCNIDK